MKKKYKFILWDIDDTLIDFKSSERLAIKKCFSDYGVEVSDADVEVYSGINHGYWLKLERGEMKKSDVLLSRFVDFAKYLGVEVDIEKINHEYQVQLGENAVLNEYAWEIVTSLSERCGQYAVTNGTAEAQHRKLKNTRLVEVLDKIFISEEVGVEKPNVAFFDFCFSQIPDFEKQHAIIVGDSATSDIKGGNNAGIDTCFFSKKGGVLPCGIHADYIISSLQELFEIL